MEIAQLYRKRARLAHPIGAWAAQPMMRALALEGLAPSEARPGLGRHGFAMHVPTLAPHVCLPRIAYATSSSAGTGAGALVPMAIPQLRRCLTA